MKRLKDYQVEGRKQRSMMEGQVLPMDFSNDDATKRIVIHTVKRVIQKHKEEIQALAYK